MKNANKGVAKRYTRRRTLAVIVASVFMSNVNCFSMPVHDFTEHTPQTFNHAKIGPFQLGLIGPLQLKNSHLLNAYAKEINLYKGYESNVPAKAVTSEISEILTTTSTTNTNTTTTIITSTTSNENKEIELEEQDLTDNCEIFTAEDVVVGSECYETYVSDIYEEVDSGYYEEVISNETAEQELVTYSWNGPVLTSYLGTVYGPSGKETYYNLPMDGVISIMRGLGYDYSYWIRSDGVKMYGDYVMCAACFSVHPRGSLVETSLGTGIVCDTGGFAYSNPNQLDIATSW